MPCTVTDSHAVWAEVRGKEGKLGLKKHHTAAGAFGVGRPFFLHVLLKSPVTHTAKML